MNIIDIDTSLPYKVLVGGNLISKSGELIRKHAGLRKNAETAVVISDDTVYGLYGSTVEKSLEDAGFAVERYVFAHGEASKNAAELINILEFLASCHVTRTDFIVALGGGVTGDLAGFAAATYLRGIDFIQIPTTVLACVDSSVGGKTGIDLKAGKNLAGAFHQPLLVICDPDTLDTLPREIFRDGCAEVIKYGVLFDEVLFAHLIDRGMDFDRDYVLGRCIELKRDVVVEDEFDRGRRQLLNFGHTLAHAIEKKSNLSVTHGQAVATGMVVFADAAVRLGICDHVTAAQIRKAVTDFGLPASCAYTADEMYEIMQNDKKRRGSSISVILPERIGSCIISVMNMRELRDFLENGMGKAS